MTPDFWLGYLCGLLAAAFGLVLREVWAGWHRER